MAYYEKFSEQEIPYGTLVKFGLTQTMVEDLPQSIMNRLLESRWTPVLPIITEDEYGEKHKAAARIKLVRKTDGSVDVCFAPYCGFTKISGFTEEQQQKLQDGLVVIAEVTAKDGTKQKSYLQFDKETNQTMYVPTLVIQQNVSIMADRFGMYNSDRDVLQQCDILEITENDKTVSIGIDLYENSCLRIANGDRNLWLREAFQSEQLPQYSFGINGCWVSDGMGELSYVDDNSYTDEMQAEYDRRALQSAANAQMRR